MPYPKFDRGKLKITNLDKRVSQIKIKEICVPLDYYPSNLPEKAKIIIKKTAERIFAAHKADKPVIVTFGAHTIKNGLALVLIDLLKRGLISHLATNGAGIIHDWEFAFLGESGEDVRRNVHNGQFGIWEETGRYLNLALIAGAFEKLGYGESIGKMISLEGLNIPEPEFLLDEARHKMIDDPEYASSALELYNAIIKHKIEPGFTHISHPFKEYSVQCAAFDFKIPFTGHPMIGHDIIYTHPMNHGAAIGRTAMNDFLSYADSISRLENGVYISMGSAVMSPMVFEKSLSMAQNIEIQKNKHIDNHLIIVVDIAKNDWDWIKNGEPPADNPAYYLRHFKTFSRMGGEMHYVEADNRDFMAELYHLLVD